MDPSSTDARRVEQRWAQRGVSPREDVSSLSFSHMFSLTSASLHQFIHLRLLSDSHRIRSSEA